MVNRQIVITDFDRRRLAALIAAHADHGLAQRHYLEDLQRELERAWRVDPCDVPPDVITMNSTVQLRDLDTGDTETFTLVFPEDADVTRQRISVLAPIGTAILGYRAGDVILWPVPQGRARLRVEQVLYQPERAGVLTQ
ncbi:MAG TPA: nucleoside diphosphate kinase regulator [Pirellulales bacterium]